MFSILTKIFIKDRDNVSDPKVREAYGTLSGAYGIFLNVVLFIIKLIAGLISKSLAITADAMNNLGMRLIIAILSGRMSCVTALLSVITKIFSLSKMTSRDLQVPLLLRGPMFRLV